MRRGILAVLVCALVLLASTVRAQKADAEQIFNGALSHLREGRPELALEEFNRAIRMEPKNAYFYKGRGVAYLSLKRLPEAIAAFRKALDLDPYYVDARNDLGTALILSGERDEGKRMLVAAYNEPMNPTPEVTARNLGRTYKDEGDLEQALTWYNTSVRRNPRFADAHIGLAETLAAMGRMDEAIRHLEMATAKTAENVRVVFALGQAYYRAGRWDEARGRLEEVVKAQPAGDVGKRAAELLENFPKK
jgi:Flp pilus assembly protein TadD